jgi:hypothetical protein
MKTSSTAKSRCFKFLSEAAIRAERFDLSTWQSAQLRAKLPKGIYWIQPVEGVICITPPKGGISIFIAKSYQLSDVDTLELN